MAATAYFNRFSSYCKMVAHAKNLAKQSVLIDHCGLEHIDLTAEFKNVDHVYSIEKETRKGFAKLSLIEFKSKEDADRVVKQAHHNEGLLPVPLKILRYNGRTSPSPAQQDLPFPVEHVRISCERELLPSFKSYTDLIANNMMSLVSLKLRFVTLVNFERILCSGMFEEYELMPFGSSVIDMGCESGDLDLVITRREDHHQAILNSSTYSQRTSRSGCSSKLVHLDKSLYSEAKDNSGFRGTMRWFDHVLKEYMPLTDGFGVLSLHRAKVPIIKFTSRITNIECDLSFDLGLDNRDNEALAHVHPGILMTEILYSLCRNNNLITALVIYLRIFAKMNSITSKVPGIGMTNFQFLSLIIFFLQQVSITCASQQKGSSSSSLDNQIEGSESSAGNKFTITYVKSKDQRALVPPFKVMMNGNYFVNQSYPVHFDDDQLNQLLPKLIVRFFDFYSNFDFANSSLNLYESGRDRKLDNSTIYVLNPIDTSRNICHNVNRKGLENLVKQVRIASTSIKSQRGSCPLTMIKGLMIKQQKQTKKSRAITFDDLQDSNPLTPDNIAQDVCR